MSFKDLGLSTSILCELESNGIATPTEVQRISIPRILQGENIVVRSQTGSGKTLAYLLPMIDKITASTKERLLVLVPTRELAQQVGRVSAQYSTLSSAVIYGGVEYASQIESFAQNPNIIIATPGRLQDLISQGVANLHEIDNFILDEVDQMVDMGFRDAINELAQLRSAKCQILCFSATLPADVREILEELSPNSSVITCEGQPLAAQRIIQSGYYVERSIMDQLLIHLIRSKSPAKSIVFCRSKKMADRLTSIIKESQFAAEAIHSDRSQAAREHILRRFIDGETKILVATDLMARGIDVDGVTHVFNYGLPQNPEQYIHRIGRTGRAGASGEAISLLCPDEKKVLDATCALMKQPIQILTNHPYVTPAVTLALQGMSSRKKARK